MPRPANPNKEKIAEIKSQIKEHSRTVRQGESAATKVTKLEERLAKLTGDDTAPAKKTAKVAKTTKADKSEKKIGKKKLDAKAEKKTGKVVKKTRGRPKKVADDEEDD